MLLQGTEEGFKILDGDTAACTGAGNAGEVRGIEAEFEHPSTHARRNVAGTRSTRRDRKAASDDGFDGGLAGGDDVVVADFEVQIFDDIGTARGHLRHRRDLRGVRNAERLGRLLSDFECAERGTDGVAGLRHGENLADPPATWRSDGHGGLVGLDLEDVTAGLDGAAGFDQDANDGGFGDGFAELRHQDGDGGHGGRLDARYLMLD